MFIKLTIVTGEAFLLKPFAIDSALEVSGESKKKVNVIESTTSRYVIYVKETVDQIISIVNGSYNEDNAE